MEGKEKKAIEKACAPTRTRTWNPLIKSQLLYQLSHGCKNTCCQIPLSRRKHGTSQRDAQNDINSHLKRSLVVLAIACPPESHSRDVGGSYGCNTIVPKGSLREKLQIGNRQFPDHYPLLTSEAEVEAESLPAARAEGHRPQAPAIGSRLALYARLGAGQRG